jgi:hypothetical protein
MRDFTQNGELRVAQLQAIAIDVSASEDNREAALRDLDIELEFLQPVKGGGDGENE